MSLRDTLKTEKAKERYDRNFNSVETTFSQKELEEHDKEIRAKTIDELKNKVCMHFADWKYSEDDKCIKDLIELASESVEEIAEQMKAGD